MIAVPPWVLGAIILLAGCGLVSATAACEEKKKNDDNEPDLSTEGQMAAMGLILCVCGAWVLWIGPNPEPLSAWIAIACGMMAGAALGFNAPTTGRAGTGFAMMATSILMAATLIIRASLPGFE